MKKTKNLLIALLTSAAFDVYACSQLVERSGWTDEQCQEDIDFFNRGVEERRKEQEEARRIMDELEKNHDYTIKISDQDKCTNIAMMAFAEIMGMKSIAGVLYIEHDKKNGQFCKSFKLITNNPTERLCNSFGKFSAIVPPSSEAIAECQKAKQCNYDFCK